ncbi:hypothetical protein HGRIS_005792 [Hohenbuehelia grisea]|uniref:Uncharacterized protein n=1 Tax=Hohenbuehelia grisea TaxID=104357 RepID=A0ABR3JYZ8_9AGAR
MAPFTPEPLPFPLQLAPMPSMVKPDAFAIPGISSDCLSYELPNGGLVPPPMYPVQGQDVHAFNQQLPLPDMSWFNDNLDFLLNFAEPAPLYTGENYNAMGFGGQNALLAEMQVLNFNGAQTMHKQDAADYLCPPTGNYIDGVNYTNANYTNANYANDNFALPLHTFITHPT